MSAWAATLRWDTRHYWQAGGGDHVISLCGFEVKRAELQHVERGRACRTCEKRASQSTGEVQHADGGDTQVSECFAPGAVEDWRIFGCDELGRAWRGRAGRGRTRLGRARQGVNDQQTQGVNL